MTNWYVPCAYNAVVKKRFHKTAYSRLRRLAKVLGFSARTFDLRSNPGGIAVSGEITLHHEDVYVQVSQPATRADTGIMIRTCEGRRDYSGGPNHYAPLRLLHDEAALAAAVRRVLAAKTKQ
jgi:hypothetical protein